MRSSGSVSGRRSAALGVVTVIAVAAPLATACSGSSSPSGSASVATSTMVTVAPASAPTIGDPASDLDPVVVSALDSAVEAAAGTAPLPSQVTLPSVESTGIPGLDSPDEFCAAWSRFAGSFQVVAVTAAFGEGGPEAVATLEVVASPIATEAYTALFDAWPAELDPEREIVADQVLGPFQRRLADARAALEAAAGDPAALDAIRSAWLATLAARDPTSPEVSVDLGDAEWAVVDAATQVFVGVRAPFSADPSLVNDVDTPLTDAYLAATCPDQGQLAGQDVVEG